MASVQEYCGKLPDDVLENIIFCDAAGYSGDVITIVCHELLRRHPDRLDVLKILWEIEDAE